MIEDLDDRVIGKIAGEAMKDVDEGLTCWGSVFETWLIERETLGRRVRRRGELAWAELLEFSKKAPWKIRTDDVKAWVEAQEREGRSASTIQGRLTAIAKFYEFVNERGIDDEFGEGLELANPVDGIERPQPAARKGDTTTLSPRQMEHLLYSAGSDRSLLGKRDYALVTLALTSAQQLDPVRRLKIEAIDLGRSRGWVVWKRGNTMRKERLHPTARVALEEHLGNASPVVDKNGSGYVFAVTDKVYGDGKVCWVWDRPLSRQQVLRIVRQHASWVRIKAKQVTWQTLRNTAVLIRVADEEPLEQIHTLLGRAELAKTKAYVKKMLCNLTYVDWMDDIFPDAEPEAYLRGRAGAKPKHGYYSKYLLYDEYPAELLRELGLFEREMLRLRMVRCRAEELYFAGKDGADEKEIRDEMIRLLLVQLETTWRIGRMKVRSSEVEIGRRVLNR